MSVAKKQKFSPVLRRPVCRSIFLGDGWKKFLDLRTVVYRQLASAYVKVFIKLRLKFLTYTLSFSQNGPTVKVPKRDWSTGETVMERY